MIGFEYPTKPHARRHGPAGYSDYGSYRDWLRDEFVFRCVYCLHREQWYNRGATFNEAKKAILHLPDPCKVAFHDCLHMTSDGRVRALNHDGEKLIQVLRLDNDSNVRHRSLVIRALEALRTNDPGLYEEYLRFPADLPDLRRKKVPENTRPEGAANCYFAL